MNFYCLRLDFDNKFCYTKVILFRHIVKEVKFLHPRRLTKGGVTTIKLHHKIFLAYSSVFLVTIGVILVIANILIGHTFGEQIRKEATEFQAGISELQGLLVNDIRNEVRFRTEDPLVVRAILDGVPNSRTNEDTELDILEYGKADGRIIASQLDSDPRLGEIDKDALTRTTGEKIASGIRMRTRGDTPESAIEVTLPVASRDNQFLGFVTGGYFLRAWLNQRLSGQPQPIFLKEGARRFALNGLAEKIISTGELDEASSLPDNITDEFQVVTFNDIPHSVTHTPLLLSNVHTPVELIIAYSHRNQIEFQRRLIYILLIAGVGGLVVVYIVSYLIGIQVTKPINRLTEGATEIASGNLEHRVHVQSRDELGQLAAAFNQMRADLKVNLEKLLTTERIAAWKDVARRIAHEIKNPLFPIRISVENLQHAKSEPEIFDELFDECTETVLEEVTRLQRMVDEFSQFARMPAPERKSADLNRIVRHATGLYAESAQSVAVETTLAFDLPNISVDSEQLTQVLENLIKNSIEAMPDGGTLTVSTQLTDDAKIQILIQDTGIGMSPETQAQLFTPYYTTKESGTGLGMAIVQRIITDHDGEIQVNSTEGVGTTVLIELPM